MDKTQRSKIRTVIKSDQEKYLDQLKALDCFDSFNRRFKTLAKAVRDLLRKTPGSANSLQQISRLGKIAFGLQEDIKRLNLPNYSFNKELNIANKFVVDYLVPLWANKYDGKCARYGETGLALYIDVFIALTVSDADLLFQSKPSFLMNPKTGALMEIDVRLEKYRLAFEFQGEHHYTVNKKMQKDRDKLQLTRLHNHVLVPVNISQLNSLILQNLIANSMKDYLGIHNLLISSGTLFDPSKSSNPRPYLQFSKIIQRLYLAKTIFSDSLKWLDAQTAIYIANNMRGSPISSSSPAPRQIIPIGDMDIGDIYRRLRYVKKANKTSKRAKRRE
jgi:hypothetical protein